MKKHIHTLLLVALFASCATESKFVKFHDKKPSKAARHCSIWFPIVEDSLISTKTIYKEGEIIYLPGETEFLSVDCDSAVKAELDNAAKNVQNSKGKDIRVPIPRKVDTLIKTQKYYVENTAYKAVLLDSILKINVKKDKAVLRLSEVKSTRNKLWGILAFIGAIALAYLYFRIKSSFIPTTVLK